MWHAALTTATHNGAVGLLNSHIAASSRCVATVGIVLHLLGHNGQDRVIHRVTAAARHSNSNIHDRHTTGRGRAYYRVSTARWCRYICCVADCPIGQEHIRRAGGINAGAHFWSVAKVSLGAADCAVDSNSELARCAIHRKAVACPLVAADIHNTCSSRQGILS